MRFFAFIAAIFVSLSAYAQVDVDGSGGGSMMYNNISTSTIRTEASRTWVMGSITTAIPRVSNSLIYKDANGVIQTTSQTFVTNTGSTNEALVSANVNVLNGLTIPVASAGVTPTLGNIAVTPSGKICVKTGSVWKDLTSLNVVGNILTGIGLGSPSVCIF